MPLIHSNPQFHIISRCGVIAPESHWSKTKTGHSPRQRTNGPDHKLPMMEVAMAEKANTPKPCERQDNLYARPMPIGEVAHNLIRNLEKRVVK